MCVCAGGDQKRICKCKVADVNMPYAGGNQLRKAPAGCRAAWTDVHEHNPIERNADPQKLK